MCSAPKLVGVVLALGLAGCSVAPRAPSDGRYDGELCVATGAGPPNCGAAQVSLANGRAKVRVNDLVYDLLLEDGQLDVMLIHGTTLVDVFSTTYAWDERFLRFVDTDRRVYYRVRFANPPGAGSPSSN